MRPALDVIRDDGTSPRALLYLDPPYLATTRRTSAYAHNMATEAEHRALAAALHRCRCRVVRSGYDSPLYQALYDGWHRLTVASSTHRGNGARRARTEVLWSNVPLHTPPPSQATSRTRHRGSPHRRSRRDRA